MRKSSSSMTAPATTRPKLFAHSQQKIGRCAWWRIPAIAAKDTACATACSTPAVGSCCSATPTCHRRSKKLPKLFKALDDGADIAIGSRWLRAETQTQRQPLHRQLFGRIFNLVLRLTLGLQFKDTQCGFKAFKQPAVQAIFPLQKIERWGFDPEILFLARKFKFKVQEVPVAWGHGGGTRINPLVDGSRMVMEMLHIRWNDLTGKYDDGPTITAQPTKAPDSDRSRPSGSVRVRVFDPDGPSTARQPATTKLREPRSGGIRYPMNVRS